MDKKQKFEQIKKEVEELKTSPLYKYRKSNDYKPVIGEGSLDAKVMFIGEAPGKNEAETGRPFVGSAGNILNGLLKKAGLEREDVFITSILFDRPPNNRNPKKKEIEVYKPYLKKIVSLIDPDVIVTLGNFAIKTLSEEYYFSDEFGTLRTDHGKVMRTKVNDKNKKTFISYHPAAILYNKSLEDVIKDDFASLKNII